MKKIILLFLLCVSVLFAKDYTVTLKAKGQFGEDLKTLIEKYKKNGNIEVVETKHAKKETIDKQIADFFSDQKNEENYKKMVSRTNEGKRIYNLKCASCHGKSGEDSSYGGKPLNEMKLEEYLSYMDAYGNTDGDDEAASHQSFAMTQYANTVTNEQNIGIYQYLQKLKNPKSNNKKNTNKEIESQNESSSYLQ